MTKKIFSFSKNLRQETNLVSKNSLSNFCRNISTLIPSEITQRISLRLFEKVNTHEV